MTQNGSKPVTAMSVKMLAVIITGDDGSISGELDCEYFAEPFTFTSLVRMIEMMETTFDTKGFPEKQMLPRTFGKAKQRLRKNELDLDAFMKEQTGTINSPVMQSQTKPDGKTCTFEILVRFRHSAEWQGSIHWIEKDTTKQFSSIVELLKLMDKALADT